MYGYVYVLVLVLLGFVVAAADVEHHLTGHAGFLNFAYELADGNVLACDVEIDIYAVLAGGERFSQRRDLDGLAVGADIGVRTLAHVELQDLVVGERRDGTGSGGCLVDGLVVHQYQNIVLGGAYVELDHVGSLFDGLLDVGNRVVGNVLQDAFVGIAAVCDDVDAAARAALLLFLDQAVEQSEQGLPDFGLVVRIASGRSVFGIVLVSVACNERGRSRCQDEEGQGKFQIFLKHGFLFWKGREAVGASLPL